MPAKTILVQGLSGSGKSTAAFPNISVNIKGLKPEETFFFNVLAKELPFKGADKYYKLFDTATKKGNMLVTRNPDDIINYTKAINSKSEFKNIIVDDFQSIMSLEFFSRALEKGYDKWNEIGEKGFRYLLWLADNRSKLRDDLYIWVLTHTDEFEMGGDVVIQTKTVGQMVNNYCIPAGLFTCVLHATKKRDKMTKKLNYYLKTRPEFERDQTKTPIGMFEEQYVPNDLGSIREQMENYYKN